MSYFCFNFIFYNALFEGNLEQCPCNLTLLVLLVMVIYFQLLKENSKYSALILISY